MRKDVKLGLAVGGMLFGAVLVYVLFFAGGNSDRTKNDQTNRITVPDVPKDRGTGGQQANAANAGGEAKGGGNAVVGVPSGTGGDKIILIGPTTQPVQDAGGGSKQVPGSTVAGGSEPKGPEAGSGVAKTWDWGQALSSGASNELLSHTSLPGPGRTDGGAIANMENPTTRPSGGGRIYTVKPGDSLWTIAKAEYGSAIYWSHIARANKGVDANRLKAGSKLVLPPKDEVLPAPGLALTTPPTTQPVDPVKQYRVIAGDNLNVICRKLYGRTDLVAKLYDLNKSVIGPNMSALKVNTVLQLPEPPSKTSTIAGALQ